MKRRKNRAKARGAGKRKKADGFLMDEVSRFRTGIFRLSFSLPSGRKAEMADGARTDKKK
jgi:hypothetical protein